ncbi:hypothetical protein BHM03_00025131 [Ensete ventricosum]|nr:hypothetical protein BHM03_00025131 [Ensete ventricosum]
MAGGWLRMDYGNGKSRRSRERHHFLRLLRGGRTTMAGPIAWLAASGQSRLAAEVVAACVGKVGKDDDSRWEEAAGASTFGATAVVGEIGIWWLAAAVGRRRIVVTCRGRGDPGRGQRQYAAAAVGEEGWQQVGGEEEGGRYDDDGNDDDVDDDGDSDDDDERSDRRITTRTLRIAALIPIGRTLKDSIDTLIPIDRTLGFYHRGRGWIRGINDLFEGIGPPRSFRGDLPPRVLSFG